jgi:hypothetical protein
VNEAQHRALTERMDRIAALLEYQPKPQTGNDTVRVLERLQHISMQLDRIAMVLEAKIQTQLQAQAEEVEPVMLSPKRIKPRRKAKAD